MTLSFCLSAFSSLSKSTSSLSSSSTGNTSQVRYERSEFWRRQTRATTTTQCLASFSTPSLIELPTCIDFLFHPCVCVCIPRAIRIKGSLLIKTHRSLTLIFSIWKNFSDTFFIDETSELSAFRRHPSLQFIGQCQLELSPRQNQSPNFSRYLFFVKSPILSGVNWKSVRC